LASRLSGTRSVEIVLLKGLRFPPGGVSNADKLFQASCPHREAGLFSRIHLPSAVSARRLRPRSEPHQHVSPFVGELSRSSSTPCGGTLLARRPAEGSYASGCDRGVRSLPKLSWSQPPAGVLRTLGRVCNDLRSLIAEHGPKAVKTLWTRLPTGREVRHLFIKVIRRPVMGVMTFRCPATGPRRLSEADQHVLSRSRAPPFLQKRCLCVGTILSPPWDLDKK
jgi:hypothetical protein